MTNCQLCASREGRIAMQPLRLTRPLQLVEWDLGTPLEGYADQKWWLLVDIFTKWAEVIPSKTL